MALRTAVETTALRTMMSLPTRIQRALSGRPPEVDGQTLAVDLHLMLRMERLARKKGTEALPPEAGRRALLVNTAMVGGEQQIGSVRDLEVAGLPARLYRPSAPLAAAGTAGPVLVYFHGGGYMQGDLDSHEAPCRFLAEQSGVPVLAVDYRLAPEHPFPAAHDDAEAAYRWVLDHAGDLGVDPQRVAVGGDSAGGNLAGAVAITTAREGLPLAWQLLVYPCTDFERDNDSLRLFGQGYYLTADFMDVANERYTPDPADRRDPRASLVLAEVPEGLAPAYVVTAGFDPLRDEGEAYADRLAEAGAPVECRRFPDQIHGFLNILAVEGSSRAAVTEIAAKLRAALS